MMDCILNEMVILIGLIEQCVNNVLLKPGD